jgi:DNA repair exonuclease SbcCD ATPase subunit
MKNIAFKKVSLKNFLSVGKEPVEVEFKSGLHIITGVNRDKEDRRNGVGKSTVADAIHFGVFGNTLRDLKKELIVNNINKTNCEVVLDIEIENLGKKDDIQITRSLEPSRCYLKINGKDVTRDSITNTNEYILQLLNCTEDVFQNCVIMTVNNTIPFMAKKKQDKRKFIEDIFNLSVFSDMLSRLKEDIIDTKREFDIESTKFDEIERNITVLEKQKVSAEAEQKARKAKYENRKKNNADELISIEKKLKAFVKHDVSEIEKQIDEQRNNIEKVDSKLIKIRHNISEKQTFIKQLNKQFSTIDTLKGKCPMCLRNIVDIDKKHIEKEKEKINKQIDEYDEEIEKNEKDVETLLSLEKKLDEKIKTFQTKINNFNLEKKDYDNTLSRKKQLEAWQIELDQDLKDIKNNVKNYDSLIDDQNKKLKVINKKIDELKKAIKLQETAKFVVSEEGVKAYIVKKILQLFNSKLIFYLKKMDANCHCTFNEYFEEEIIDDKGKLCSYFNFSGAERKNIDLACLFAFMDIRRLQGDVTYNFSIYDELFDSSLDEKGVDLVINILRERVQNFNESVMIISHRKESVKSASGDIIFLEKRNGITRKVDYLPN